MVGLTVNTPLLVVIPRTLRVSVPLFEIVIAVSLNDPTLTFPKLTVELLNANIGKRVLPVPDALTVSGLVNELLVTENLPETLPPADGANLRVSTREWPGGIFALPGRAVNTERLPRMFAIFSVSVPVFEMVTIVSLKNPTLTIPKLMLPGLNARIG